MSNIIKEMENTTEVKMKPEVVEAIKKGLTVKNRLQLELNISFLTLQRWLKGNDDKLTQAKVLNIVSDELGIDKDQLLTA